MVLSRRRRGAGNPIRIYDTFERALSIERGREAGSANSVSSLPRRGIVAEALSLIVRIAPTGRKFYQRLIFVRKRLDEDLQDPPLPEGLRGVWAGTPEIEWIDSHPEANARGTYRRRIARGDLCLCLKTGDEVIGYQWVAQRSACLFCGFDSGYELPFFPFQSHQVFTYDTLVYNDHRRRGYATLIRKLLLKNLREKGIREVFALIAPENLPSLKIDLELGFEPYCMAYGVRIRNWSKMILGLRPDSKLAAWIEEFKRGGTS